MSRLRNVHSHARRKLGLTLTSLCLGCSTLTMGCGIPNQRCAQPGPVLPEAYNWNNGVPFGSASTPSMQMPTSTSPTTTQADEVEDPSEKSTSLLSKISDAFRFRKDPSVSQPEKDAVAPATPAAQVKQPTATSAPPDNSEVQAASGTKDEGLVKVASSFWTQDPDADESMSKEAATNEPDRDLVCAPGENSSFVPQATFYNNPYLNDIISQALVGNQELRILAEEIRIANYETYARSGEYRPFVTGGVGAGIEKPGLYTRGGAVEDQLEVAPDKAFPDPLPNFLVGTQISWELDIWRRLRNAQQAAAMRYLGSREGRNFVVTRLVAEIAENYYKLLALDSRLATLETTIEIQQASLQVADAKKAAGRGTELAVKRFEAEVEKNNAERTIIQQEIVETENRINFLAGRFPQHVDRPSVAFVDLAFNQLCSGIPSELLQNRADIRQAEREVSATGLDVRVARARFYPSLNLTGGLGWNAFSTGYLFRTPESLMYGVGADLVGPLINKRAIQAAYSTANAKQLQAIYNYQQTILKAHIEVVNYLSKVENYQRSVEVKKQQLLALEASVDAANNLFQNARAEYVEVLLAQRELMEARMLLIDIKQEQLAAVINAYQALGGGWY
ncbi:MAG: TolC family protein [Planctomycetota bacterium]